MPLHIEDLFDLAYLDERIASGYVRVQEHPSEPLRIFNYTEKAQYESAWDVVTKTCRGLIVDARGVVLARPFAKFFNYGDPLAGELDLSAMAVVIDKMDGSLGIIYPTPDGWAVATRGSFTSPQAIHATDVLRRRYPEFVPPQGVTALVEIVYPDNRIVCDYGGADDLFLLGGVGIGDGRVFGPEYIPAWAGPTAKVFSVWTLADALALPPRPGAEGLVVRLVESGRMVKIKQADYVAMHKVITGLNARGVWDALGEGKTVADICEPLPDEFHQWVKDIAGNLLREAGDILDGAELAHEQILATLPAGWTRKDYALAAAKSTFRPWLFNLLDGRDPRPAIWKTLRPSGDVRPISFSEDAA